MIKNKKGKMPIDNIHERERKAGIKITRLMQKQNSNINFFIKKSNIIKKDSNTKQIEHIWKDLEG